MSRDMSFVHRPITNRQEGEAFIALLQANGLMFHFEDDVHDIIWGETGEAPSFTELCAMDARRNELYELDWGEHECPIGFALTLMDQMDD